jgi:DNA polymerase-3 subunit beta
MTASTMPAPTTGASTTSAGFDATVRRDALREGLDAVLAAVPSKTTLPVLGNFLVVAGDGTLTITGTDLDAVIVATIPADVSRQGSTTIPAKKFTEIVREMAGDVIKLSGKGDSQMTVEAGRSKFKLLCMGAEEFPATTVVNFDKGWAISAGVLKTLIEHTSFAVSQEESRPILNGVLWELGASAMSMVATDGHRLSKMTAPVVSAGAPETSLIVPPKALAQIVRLFGADEDITVAQAENGNYLGFKGTTRTLMTRLISGPYPNYAQVIPKANDKTVEADTAAMAAGLRRMSILAGDQSRRVRLAFDANSLRFSVTTPDLGDANDEMPVGYTGDRLEIGFNASYLLDILKHITTPTVRITLLSPERAATFHPVGENQKGELLCLAMPLRLTE